MFNFVGVTVYPNDVKVCKSFILNDGFESFVHFCEIFFRVQQTFDKVHLEFAQSVRCLLTLVVLAKRICDIQKHASEAAICTDCWG